MAIIEDVNGFLKEKYGIKVPVDPGFDVNTRIKLKHGGALEGVYIVYTDEDTGTKLIFITQIERRVAGRYCGFHADRLLSDEESLRAMHEDILYWGYGFVEHDALRYSGSEGSVSVPIDNSGDEHEFITLLHRSLPLIRVALKNFGRHYDEETEYTSLSSSTCTVLAMDYTLDDYKELLHEEFED